MGCILCTNREMSKEKVYYTYKGKKYEIISTDVPAEQLLSDFKHCESIGDWRTIENRIAGGLMWNWIIEVKNLN